MKVIISILILMSFSSCGKYIITSEKIPDPTKLDTKPDYVRYALVKKYYRVNYSYDIVELYKPDGGFCRVKTCELKDDVIVTSDLVADENCVFKLKSNKSTNTILSVNYGNTNVLNAVTASVAPIGDEILTGTVDVLKNILATAKTFKVVFKGRVVCDTVEARTRTMKFSYLIPLNKVADFKAPIVLPYPKFDTTTVDFPKLSISFTPFVKKTIFNDCVKDTKSYDGIFYREPVPVRIQVHYARHTGQSRQDNTIIDEVTYVPQIGDVHFLPINLSYGLFSGKREITLTIDNTTGAIKTVKIDKQSKAKEGLAAVNGVISTLGDQVRKYTSEEEKLKNEKEKLQTQKDILDLKHAIENLKNGN
jgi:hypothetical protein